MMLQVDLDTVSVIGCIMVPECEFQVLVLFNVEQLI